MTITVISVHDVHLAIIVSSDKHLLLKVMRVWVISLDVKSSGDGRRLFFS